MTKYTKLRLELTNNNEDEQKLQGVYSIYNKVNGKTYYGGAAQSFAIRWNEHIGDLETNKHRNIHLQRAWNKYGSKAFTFVIELICGPDECVFHEQQYLNWFWDGDNECYNINPRADTILGMTLTEESVDKMATTQRGRKGKNNTSGYAGINKYDKRWRVVIGNRGKDEYIGSFITLEEAVEAHKIALELINNKQELPKRNVMCTNISGYTGVTWHNRSKRWRAQITIDGKQKEIGTFIKLEDAIKARQVAEKIIKEGNELPKKNTK